MSYMKALHDMFMEAPLADLANIFIRRFMMGLEVSQLSDDTLNQLQQLIEEEQMNRLCSYIAPEVIHDYD